MLLRMNTSFASRFCYNERISLCSSHPLLPFFYMQKYSLKIVTSTLRLLGHPLLVSLDPSVVPAHELELWNLKSLSIVLGTSSALYTHSTHKS